MGKADIYDVKVDISRRLQVAVMQTNIYRAAL